MKASLTKLFKKGFYLILIPILMGSIFLPMLEAQRAKAMSDADLKAVLYNEAHYDPDACFPGSAPGSNNGSVYAIGDSILDSAISFGDLKKSLTNNGYDSNNITFDAIWGRSINGAGQTTHGKAPISAYDSASSNIDKIAEAGTIIVVLGTNPDTYDASIPKFMKLIRERNPEGRIFWVNVGTRTQTSTMNSSNKAIDKYKDTYKYTIIDWHQTVLDNPSLIPTSPNGDGIHPSTDGSKELTKLIATALGKYDKTTVSGGTGGSAQSGNQDYAKLMKDALGDAYLKNFLKKVEENRPAYEEAANKVGIPWQMLAVVHNNETGFSHSNPSNGQGIYQFYERAGQYPPGPVTDAEFMNQTVDAAKFLKQKASNAEKELKASGSTEDAVKATFFYYNGTGGTVYAEQAHRLGFNEAYEGSPYVMNFADDKRNPKKNPNWVQFTCDGDCVRTANTSFVGAWVQYVIAGGANGGSTGNCDSSTTSGGPTPFGWELKDIVFYSQCDPKWANKPYGSSGTICTSGCGLTSVTIAVATLTGNKDITPAVLAIKYASYHIPGSGTSWALLQRAADDYGLKNKDIGTDFGAAKEILKKGGLILAAFGSGAFTSQGHFMVIRAFDAEGKFYIADPYNGNHNGGYTTSYIMSQGNLTNMWGYTKP